MIRYRIVGSPEMRGIIPHLPPDVKRKAHASLRLLEEDPLAGKLLEGELTGYRSYPIPPYRIIYRVEPSSRVVRIVRIGHRNDVYEVLVQKIGAGEVREKRAIYVRR